MTDRFTRQELRLERLLDAPVATVWRWLVEPELRARWFIAGPTDLRVGGAFGLTMDHANLSDGDVPTPEKYRGAVGHSWSEKITRLGPERVLAFEWDEERNGEVTFTLTPEGERTRLVLVHSGITDPDGAANFGGGWDTTWRCWIDGCAAMPCPISGHCMPRRKRGRGRHWPTRRRNKSRVVGRRSSRRRPGRPGCAISVANCYTRRPVNS